MTPDRAGVFGGVDTHKDVHVAAAVDAAGRLLGTAEFAADSRAMTSSPAGWSLGALWAASESRAPDPTVRASPGTSPRPASRWWR